MSEYLTEEEIADALAEIGETGSYEVRGEDLLIKPEENYENWKFCGAVEDEAVVDRIWIEMNSAGVPESEEVFHLDPAYRNDPPKPKSVTLPESLVNRLQRLAEEDSTRSIVIRFLERYMDIVKTGNREIRRNFTDAELSLITEVCGDLSFESLELAVDAQLVATTVETAVLYCPGVYGAKWDVDEGELVAQIRQLYGGGQIALIQFIETMSQTQVMKVEDYFKLK